jgi:hypothetical protein
VLLQLPAGKSRVHCCSRQEKAECAATPGRKKQSVAAAFSAENAQKCKVNHEGQVALFF